jgi:GTP-binding protein HflX
MPASRALFNSLVNARAYAADQLFATLDTTTRQLYLGEAGRSVSLSDTVGFIRNLPHGLIDAFEATLQEAVDADVLLHVVDASNPAPSRSRWPKYSACAGEIGADGVPQVLVFNKLDAIEIGATSPCNWRTTSTWTACRPPGLCQCAHGEGLVATAHAALRRWRKAQCPDSSPRIFPSRTSLTRQRLIGHNRDLTERRREAEMKFNLPDAQGRRTHGASAACSI